MNFLDLIVPLANINNVCEKMYEILADVGRLYKSQSTFNYIRALILSFSLSLSPYLLSLSKIYILLNAFLFIDSKRRNVTNDKYLTRSTY